MRTPQKTSKAISTRAQNTRPTIGLLTRNVDDWVHQLPWLGIVDVAREKDVNVICFPGGALRSPYGFEAQANVLYDLVNVEQFDGLIITPISLGLFVNRKEITDFGRRYQAVPVVAAGVIPNRIATVTVEDRSDVRQLMAHLVEIHGYRRIAFVPGPESHVGAQKRYQTYIEMLAKYGLPFDPNLVAAPDADWLDRTEIRRFLDRRNLPEQLDFDAVVGANDERALIMLEELQARGVRVPDDVGVVGVDNRPESRTAQPPLTTGRTPLYELGQKHAELLLAHLRGESVLESVVVSPKAVVRRSCGCLPAIAAQAAMGQVGLDKDVEAESFGAILAARRAEIVAEIVQVVEASQVEVAMGWAEELLAALASQLSDDPVTSSSVTSSNEAKRSFVLALEHVLYQVAAAGEDVNLWQNAISVLRRHLLPYLHDPETLTRAEDLWHQARVLINELERWVAANQHQAARHQADTLREIGAALITTFDLAKLMTILAQELPRLDIPSAYLSLYENPEAPAKWARLMLACTAAGRVKLASEGKRFPSRQLVPVDMLPQDRRYDLVVEAFYFREEQLGFIVFEMGPLDGNIYKALGQQISSALKGALLVQQVQDHTANLEAEVGVRTADLYAANKKLQQEITERMQAEDKLTISLQEKEVLLKEIHHRVKNNLQVISSLLDLQSDYIKDEQAREVFKDSQNRIRSMALIHQRLYQTEDLANIDFAEYVDSLTDYLTRSYGAGMSAIRLQINIAPVLLSIETAVPCGLIINELISNAIKHAFPDGRAGEIWIALETAEDHQLTLLVKDDGVGFPSEVDFRRTTSLGLTLVTTLVSQLKGTIELQREPETEFTITFSDPAAGYVKAIRVVPK